MKIYSSYPILTYPLLLVCSVAIVLSACGGRSSTGSSSTSGSGSGGTTTPAVQLGLNIDGAERPTSTGGSWISDSNQVLTLTCDRDCDFAVSSPAGITTFEGAVITARTWKAQVRNIGASGDLLSVTVKAKDDAGIKNNPSIIVRPDLAYRIKLAAGNTDIIERNATTIKVLRDTRLDLQNLNNQAQELLTPVTVTLSNINGSALTDLSPYGAYVNKTGTTTPLNGAEGVWAFQFAAQAATTLQGFDLKLTKASRDTIFRIRFLDDNDKATGGQIVNAGLTGKPQCSACHGVDGASPNANGANKTINGKAPLTTINLIRAYRDGTNSNATSTRDKKDRMNLLTPEEVMKVAWYLSEK